jgi:hypothetical protein
MEPLHHNEFRSKTVEGTTEYFWGTLQFPEEVLAAWKRLTLQQMEIQFQEKRKAENRCGEEDTFKRRRMELELATEEFALTKAKTETLKTEADLADCKLLRKLAESGHTEAISVFLSRLSV